MTGSKKTILILLLVSTSLSLTAADHTKGKGSGWWHRLAYLCGSRKTMINRIDTSHQHNASPLNPVLESAHQESPNQVRAISLGQEEEKSIARIEIGKELGSPKIPTLALSDLSQEETTLPNSLEPNYRRPIIPRRSLGRRGLLPPLSNPPSIILRSATPRKAL